MKAGDRKARVDCTCIECLLSINMGASCGRIQDRIHLPVISLSSSNHSAA